MATIKTVEYRCPHCNKKVSSIPRNDYCAIKSALYGEPFETCPKCKQVYRHPFTQEPASGLTMKEQVPFWITSVRFLVCIAILAVFSITFTFGMGLMVVIPLYLAVCVFTRKRRQEHKNELLLQSRQRLKNPEYFIRHLLANTYIPDKNKLTASAIAQIHVRAIRAMDADQPLVLGPIVKDVIGN